MPWRMILRYTPSFVRCPESPSSREFRKARALNVIDGTAPDLQDGCCAGPVLPVLRGGVRGLVAPTVFKTDVAEHLGQAGSIPVRLRQSTKAVVHQRDGPMSVCRYLAVLCS